MEGLLANVQREGQQHMVSMAKKEKEKAAGLFAGAKVAICELPFALISSETKGGPGGTCVLRGCVPKKMLSIGGEMREAISAAEEFG